MKTLGRVSLGLLVLAFIAASAVGADEPKRVLMVHSFGSTAPPFRIQKQGSRAYCRPGPESRTAGWTWPASVYCPSMSVG